MLPYFLVFLASLVVDLVPIIGPPAWTMMVLLLVKFDLDPWLVLACGVPGSVLGRYTLSLYIPWLSDRIITRRKNEELEFVGLKLNQKLWQTWGFVLVYSISPLPTTPLFSIAGLARTNPMLIIPPFFVGKFCSDAVMLFTSRAAFASLPELFAGTFSTKGLITAGFSLFALGPFLFLDWRALLEKKKVRFSVHIWK